MAKSKAQAKIHGLPELARTLSTLERKVRTKLLKDALKPGAQIIREQAINNCPVDEGDLKRSIKIRAAKRKKGFTGVAVVTNASTKTDETYAGFVELGTRKKQGVGFFRAAFDSKWQNAVDMTSSILISRLDELKKQ